MPSEYAIADMHVFPLQRQQGQLTLLRNSDHLLRRFGQLDVIDIKNGEQTDYTVRAEADRFLFIIDGAAELSLFDMRAQSPSNGTRVALSLTSDEPKGVLVPFGVAYMLYATADTRLISLSTHSESHTHDTSLHQDELEKYIRAQ
jgi:hypothetical protein